ncbi:MAG TPA: response regulator transcription factor [Bryobacteraceae bacterium]|nr:response regulator transcription factor [Bryobacteraceae bacterium]
MITVLLVDDHSLVRRGFRRMLDDEPDIEVVGEAGDGRDAVNLAVRLRPQVVVMDYAMPGLDGVQATNELRMHAPECAVLMLSMHADDNYIRNAADAGARGYLLKNAIDIELPQAIRDIAGGKTIGLPKQSPTQENGFEELTPRERQVLQLIAQGHSNKEIAQLLELSVNTVSVHRANLMNTLDIHRTAELVLYAIRKGLVSPQ